jgi:hypothetical protein
MPLAPAPLTTIRTSPIFFFAISRALTRAAPEMMAVPCWSSWNTGILRRFLSVSSTWKHSGALMSSRLIPPKVGSSMAAVSMIFSGSVVASSMSKQSISANRLNRTPLPSMTGFPARAPMLPRPRTAVPSVMTATRFPRAVYSKARSGFFWISRQGTATPGVYARDSSCCVVHGLVEMTSIFPFRPMR